MRKNRLFTCLLLAGLALFASWNSRAADEQETSWFRSSTVDFGVVVSDVDKSVAFYRDVLGMQEAFKFDVSNDIAREAGLTDDIPVSVHVMTAGEDETATKVKLMQVEGEAPKKQDLAFINSTLGISYMTLHVTNVNEILENAAKQGIKPIANGPADISRGSGNKMVLAILRDPDGNFVELVGPLD